MTPVKDVYKWCTGGRRGCAGNTTSVFLFFTTPKSYLWYIYTRSAFLHWPRFRGGIVGRMTSGEKLCFSFWQFFKVGQPPRFEPRSEHDDFAFAFSFFFFFATLAPSLPCCSYIRTITAVRCWATWWNLEQRENSTFGVSLGRDCRNYL